MEIDTPKKRKVDDDASASEGIPNKRGKFTRNDVTLTKRGCSHVFLCEKAEKIAKDVGLNDRKASLGSAQRLCKQNAVKCSKVFGEAQATDEKGKDEWVREVWPYSFLHSVLHSPNFPLIGL